MLPGAIALVLPVAGPGPGEPTFGGLDPLQGGRAICPKGAASPRSTRGALGTHLPRGEPGTPAWRGRPLVVTERTARPLVHPLGRGPPLPVTGHPGISRRAPSIQECGCPPAALGSQGSESREKRRCFQVTWPAQERAATVLVGHPETSFLLLLCRDWAPRDGARGLLGSRVRAECTAARHTPSGLGLGRDWPCKS